MGGNRKIALAFVASLMMAHAAIAQPAFTTSDRALPLLLRVATDEQEDTQPYKVVINHEEQYSIWPADRDTPLGWTAVGKVGTKAECLAYIKEAWSDMSPLSLRKKMERRQRQDADPQPQDVTPQPKDPESQPPQS